MKETTVGDFLNKIGFNIPKNDIGYEYLVLRSLLNEEGLSYDNKGIFSYDDAQDAINKCNELDGKNLRRDVEYCVILRWEEWPTK